MSSSAWKILTLTVIGGLAGAAALQVRGEHDGDIAPPTLVRLTSPERSRDITLSRWVDVAEGERHEFPDVTVSDDGTSWVTWLAFDNDESGDLSERIMLRSFTPEGTPGEPIRLDNPDTRRDGDSFLWPRIASDGHNLWVTWCSRSAGRWAVFGSALVDGKPVGEPIQLSNPHRNAVRPAVTVDSNGVAWVAWEEKRGPQFAVVMTTFDKPQDWLTVGDDGELSLRPTLAAGPNGEVWIAWDSYSEGRYSVWARRLQDGLMADPIRLSDDDGWNLAPSAAMGPDGTLWVTWHSNYDRQHGSRTISQRLRVAAIKDGYVFEPAVGQPPPVQASLGGQYLQVEDTVEFPNLSVDAQGRIWITARRGQGFFGLIGDADGWHGPYNLARMGWGGRGRDLRVAASPMGGVQTVARRMHRVALQQLQLPTDEPSPMAVAPQANDAMALQVSPDAAEKEATARETRERFAGEVSQSLGRADATAAGIAVPASLGEASNTLNTSALVPPLTSRRGPPDVAATWLGGATSAPARQAQEEGPLRLLMGDLHTHSWHSDGTGDPDQIYTRSRDQLHLDFVSLTDHDLSNGNVLCPGEFAYIQLMADFFNNPGRFITLKGYEWTSKTTTHGGAGHKNIYFPNDDVEFYGYGSGVDDTRTLFQYLKAKGGLAIPHHIGWTGTDWESHDPDVQPDVEIVSVHGAFEYPHNGPIEPRANLAGMFVQDGLGKGLRFGLVGGSDGHGVAWHYGVSRKEDPWSTGLTGAYTRMATREGLLSALKSRSCYATSGSTILVHLRANSASMGEELQARGPIALGIKIQAKNDLREVTLIRDGSPLRTFKPNTDNFDAQIHDGDVPGGEHFYYIRAEQVDGEMAWSSPIFVVVASQPLEASMGRPAIH